MPCPTEEEIVLALEGRLTPEQRAEIDEHVDGCSSCHSVIADVVKASSAGEPSDVEPSLPPEPIDAGRFLHRGATVGRYVIVDLAGAGGMGVVYTAYDPDLDRKVALKLCKADANLDGADTQGRLLREAQVMASLSHPNVVSVFDAGIWGDDVFFTLELVSGSNLREWLAHKRRSWRAKLQVFLEAGRGLAAAHDAGIVHRDFKPENVLVESTGRVLVTDFGLALRGPAAEPDSVAPTVPSREDGPATRAGTVVGTPGYMSPEQLRGERATVASDQYSFCVALYEALYGSRPTPAEGEARIRETGAGGRFGDGVSRAARGPRWLRRPLLRGLGAEPDVRFGSMNELIDALSGRRRRTWQRVAAAVAIATLVSILLATSWSRDRPTPCRAGYAEMAAVWNPSARAGLAKSFRRGVPLGSLSLPIVQRVFDRYAASWTSVHREACEATRVHGHQSETVLDGRMHCLALHRARLASLIDLFRKADAAVVRGSVKAVYRLPPNGRCSASAAGAEGERAPRDAQTLKRIHAVELRLARAKALADAGRYQAYLKRVRGLKPQVRALDDLALEARWSLALGRALQELRKLKKAEAAFRQGLLAATGSGRQILAGRLLSALAFTVGVFLGRRPEGRRLVRIGKAVEKRVDDPGLRASLLYSEGIFLFQKGDSAGAKKRFAQVLRLRERIHGPVHPLVSAAWTALGRATRQLGHLAEARKYFEKAVEVAVRAHGRGHPDNATSLLALAPAYRDDLGDPLKTRKVLTRALALQEKGRGPKSIDVASTLTNLALAAIDLDDLDAARARIERAFPILLKTVGPHHPLTRYAHWARGRLHDARGEYDAAIRDYETMIKHTPKKNAAAIALPLVQVALVKIEQGKAAEALPLARRALALSRKAFPPDHPAVSRDELVLCRVLSSLGDARRAKTHCETAVAAGEKKLGRDHPYVAHMRSALGQTLLLGGATREAAAALTEALAAFDKHPGQPRIRAETRFALARALWSQPSERSRALKLARAARTAFGRAPTKDRRHYLEAKRWIAKRRKQEAASRSRPPRRSPSSVPSEVRNR